MNYKMKKAIELLETSLSGIQSGAITPGYIDTFKVAYFGQSTPIKHLATTSGEKNLVVIKPFDLSIIGTIQKTLTDAGFNCYLFSKTTIAISTPILSGSELDKVKTQVRKLGEEARVSIRNIRKICRDEIDGTVTEDDKKFMEEMIQLETDEAIETINRIIDIKLKWLG